MNMTIVWTFDPRISGSEMWAVLPWWLVSHTRSRARMMGGPDRARFADALASSWSFSYRDAIRASCSAGFRPYRDCTQVRGAWTHSVRTGARVRAPLARRPRRLAQLRVDPLRRERQLLDAHPDRVMDRVRNRRRHRRVRDLARHLRS